MIRGVFHLSETTASEVMTPRTEVIALPVDTPLDEAADFILEQGHSRYPIYEENLDNIVGILLARDVWRAQRDGSTKLLSEIGREPIFVPDTKAIEQLLRDMQEEQTHIAVVIDEFGGTAGIVTIEDLVEEIVGEIEDELDETSPEFVDTATGEVEFKGSLAISELNERYGLELPDEDYTTVAGFVIGRLGRMARVGDEVQVRGGRIRVLALKGRRVDRLSLRIVAEPPEVTEESS
jgi:CBS domain containing-hemolysin-like protein